MSIEERLAAVWSGLANPHRRKVLDLLAQQPLTTGELAEQFPDLSRFAVMQHLGVLEKAGLVVPRHEGRYRYNHLNPVPIQRIYRRWLRPLARKVGEQMLALEDHVLSSEEEQMNEQADRVITIVAEIEIGAPPEKVFAALTTELDAWWPHRTREDAAIVYEPRVGGRVFEDWGDGAGMAYGQVVVYDPPHRSVLFSPGLGSSPYMSQNTEIVEQNGDGARCRKTLTLWGDVPEETEAMFRQGVPSLAERMKQHLEAAVAEPRP